MPFIPRRSVQDEDGTGLQYVPEKTRGPSKHRICSDFETMYALAQSEINPAVIIRHEATDSQREINLEIFLIGWSSDI